MGYIERLEKGRLNPTETKFREGRNNAPTVRIIEVPLPFEKDPRLNKLIVRRIEGSEDGFSISLNAGGHGDEITSVDTVFEISSKVSKDLTYGSITSLSVSVPRAVLRDSTREVIFERGKAGQDINRSFTIADPEREKGHPRHPAKRLSRMIRDIHRATFAANIGRIKNMENPPPYPAVLLDLHTEDGTNYNREDVIPYARVDNVTDDNLLGFMIYCAEVMGLPWVMEYPPEDYDKEGLGGSLTSVLTNEKKKSRRIPAVVLELGVGGRVDDHYKAFGVKAVENLIAHFKMRQSDHDLNYFGNWWQNPRRQLTEFEKIFPMHKGPFQLRDAYWLDKNDTPITLSFDKIELAVKPGDYVKTRANGGSPIGHIIPLDSLDESEYQPIYSNLNGYVLSTVGTHLYGVKDGGFAYLAACEIEDPEDRERIKEIYSEQKRKLSAPTPVKLIKKDNKKPGTSRE